MGMKERFRPTPNCDSVESHYPPIPKFDESCNLCEYRKPWWPNIRRSRPTCV